FGPAIASGSTTWARTSSSRTERSDSGSCPRCRMAEVQDVDEPHVLLTIAGRKITVRANVDGKTRLWMLLGALKVELNHRFTDRTIDKDLAAALTRFTPLG